MVGNNLELLARALLEEIPPARRESVLRKIGQIGITNQAELVGSDNRIHAKQLVEAITYLNQMHYMARWEAGGAGPRVIFGHCPYEPIIDGYPELCEMDLAMLENLLDTRVFHAAKLEASPSGARYCVFDVMGL
jgi:predicted ArsR family transcriptional regulator